MHKMSSSDAGERSRGLLAMASNTPTVPYKEIADRVLRSASQRLGVPYLVVDPGTTMHNERIDPATGMSVQWDNTGRWRAYDASPWQETILIDADYLVMTDRLNMLWGNPGDYMLCYHNSMLSGAQLEQAWATVIWFRKCPAAAALFELVGRIERNYGYYRAAYGLRNRNFRNDHAFGLADLILSANQLDPRHRLPFGITTVDHAITGMEQKDGWLTVRSADHADVLPVQDLHVMDKSWLMSPGLEKLLA
jgi:hypothetical protein